MTPLEQITLPATVSHLGPFKIFAHPTRLTEAWQAKLQEIHIPAYALDRAEIFINIYQGSTKDLPPPYIPRRQKNNPLGLWKNKWRQAQAETIDLGQTYVLDARYETDKNIAHLLKNVSPSAMAVRVERPELEAPTIVLSQNASEMAQNAYKLLGFSVLCTNSLVEGRIIQAPTGSFQARGENFGQYYNFYRSWYGNLEIPGYTPDTPRRLFIARKGTRCLINEAEVEDLLAKYGFQKRYYEEIPLAEQWSCTKNAEVVVGLHGAALASLMFNTRQVKVVELFHPGYVTTLYREITTAVGGRWCGVTGQITPDVIEQLDYKQRARRFAASPTRIDLECLEKALAELDVSP